MKDFQKQDSCKRPKKPGEENPRMGFWPGLGERNSDDGEPCLWCFQTSGMSTATVMNQNWKTDQKDFCHVLNPVVVYRRCLWEAITFSCLALSLSSSWQQLLFSPTNTQRPDRRVELCRLHWKSFSLIYKIYFINHFFFKRFDVVYRFLRSSLKRTFHQAEGECSKNCEVCEKLPIKWADKNIRILLFFWKIYFIGREKFIGIIGTLKRVIWPSANIFITSVFFHEE